MKNARPAIPIVKGEGSYLIDDQGNQYLDAISSWWVTTHGHAHPYIAKAIADQAAQLEHSIFAGFTHPKAIELAERLLEKLPQNQSKIFYTDNGSTAVEVALKMAVQYWSNQGINKPKIMAFKHAYHGDTFGAMSIGERSIFTDAFKDLLFEVVFIDVPKKGHVEATVAQIEKAAATDQVAAFIFEPLVLGAGGMIMYEPADLERILQTCQKHNILTIADEVMTGFGRTGSFFATDQIETKPDIYCLSKGLTGGTIALGATSCTETIYNAFLSDEAHKTLYHGHSFTGNPLCCAIACASLDLFEQENTMEQVKRIASKHKVFKEEINKYSAIQDIRQTGTILAIELKSEENTSYTNDLRNKIYDFFLTHHIILRPLGNVMYILPPFCITDDQLDLIYNKIKEFLKQL
jgi:adenosylmethionine-8-amino-7-oxononanoate aminotransferase